jgi:hypothetical protein
VTCHGMVCSYLLLLQSSVTIQTLKLDRVGKPRGFWSLFVVFSAFYFSKVFAYGLTFSMLSTRKETFQIYQPDRKHVKRQYLALHYHSMKLQILSHTDLTSSGLEYSFLLSLQDLDLSCKILILAKILIYFLFKILILAAISWLERYRGNLGNCKGWKLWMSHTTCFLDGFRALSKTC